jgi:hypothetical protein
MKWEAQKSGKGTLKNFFSLLSKKTLIHNKLKIAPSTIITIITEILPEKIIQLLMDAPERSKMLWWNLIKNAKGEEKVL